MNNRNFDNELKKLLEISKEIYQKVKDINKELDLDLEKDEDFMCKSFLNRQLSQMESLVLLGNRDDLILIARSMFEGALYLFYSIKNTEMCHKWRMFAFLIDKQRIERARENNEEIPPEVEEYINENSEEINRLFRRANGQYYTRWYGNKTIKKIAEESDEYLLHLYNKYYSKMSEYHHWDTASFGKRNEIIDNELNLINSNEVKLERMNAICMAFSSLFNSLKLTCNVANYKSIKLEDLEKKIKTIDGTTTTEISIIS